MLRGRNRSLCASAASSGRVQAVPLLRGRVILTPLRALLRSLARVTRRVVWIRTQRARAARRSSSGCGATGIPRRRRRYRRRAAARGEFSSAEIADEELDASRCQSASRRWPWQQRGGRKVSSSRGWTPTTSRLDPRDDRAHGRTWKRGDRRSRSVIRCRARRRVPPRPRHGLAVNPRRAPRRRGRS